MNNLMKVYHYGDCGKFDDYNPFKLIDEKYVSEMLYHIGKSEPHTLGIEELHDILGGDIDFIKTKIDKMIALDMINANEGLFSINFTMIFERDLISIDKFSKAMALEISEVILKKKNEIYKLAEKINSSKSHDVDELLYHLIGSYILDGLAIDTFSEKGLFKTSKIQKGDRDYILFGFEKCLKVDEFSENILCSCNNYRTKNLSFVSFGDAAGDRNDFYRFNRKVSSQINRVNAREETKADYINILEKTNKDIAIKCSQIVRTIIDNNNEYMKFDEEEMLYVNFLKSFQYLESENNHYKISVPIFYPDDNPIINEIHDLLIKIILPVIKENFSRAKEKLDISAVKHNVDIREVLNEMWHQVFGNINEQLVKQEMIKTPDYFKGEGRYLKAIYLE